MYKMRLIAEAAQDGHHARHFCFNKLNYLRLGTSSSQPTGKKSRQGRDIGDQQQSDDEEDLHRNDRA